MSRSRSSRSAAVRVPQEGKPSISSLAMAAVAFTIAFGGLAAHAVPIYSLGKITTESGVLNTGDVLRAIDLGGNSVTVNGVTFATSSAVTEISGTRRGSGEFNTEFAPNTPLDQIRSDSWFEDGSLSLWTLSGLVVGQDYSFPMLIPNEVNATGQSSRSTLQDERFNRSGVYDGSACQGPEGTCHNIPIRS